MAKKLKIDVLCNDGSPLKVTFKDVYGEGNRVGIGGAELALMTLCEAWNNAGHRVRLYNDPENMGESPFQQHPLTSFNPKEERDILIIFRSPNHRIEGATGKKIWLSCDQYTVGNFKEFSTMVDSIVTISEFHADYFRTTYGILGTTTIDLPIRARDYMELPEKIEHQMIFCSVPDRGLNLLAVAFPRIKQAVPDASLVITSDYRLWGNPHPGNESHIRGFLSQDSVQFMGAIPRRDMVRQQLLSQIQAYPCTYDELFCYAVAECQMAGAYPVTSSLGALSTTNMGTRIVGNPLDGRWISLFVDTIVEILQDGKLEERVDFIREEAFRRFSTKGILGEWDKLFYE